MSIISTILGVESSGRNITQGNIGDINNRNGTLAQGYFQITDPTWEQFGGLQTGYTSAIQAPYDVQLAVAQNIPIGRWGSNTRNALSANGYSFSNNQTLGQVLANNGESPGTATPNGLNATLSANENPSDPNYGDITGYNVAGVNAASTDAGSGLQGTPSLSGGATNGAIGNPLSSGGGQPVNITDLPGLDTSVTSGASTVQSGLTGAAATVANTFASGLNALQTYTSSLFVVVALVVLGVIFIAFGLGLFGKREVAQLV